jgi:molybdate transport system substrate-binding protein
VAFSRSEPAIRLSFGAFGPTGVLASEILQGAEAEVFVSANWPYMDDLCRAGLVRDPRVVAGNRLCIVVRAGNAGAVGGLASLTRPGLTVVAPQHETDPCGKYVSSLFARAGIAAAMAAKEAAGELFHSRGSTDLPQHVTDGIAAAGILYVSEALSIPGVEIVRLPAPLDMSDSIAFTIGAVGRPNPASPALRFVDHMTGHEGQQVLAEQGMLPAATVREAR